jgi:hypothetical protein
VRGNSQCFSNLRRLWVVNDVQKPIHCHSSLLWHHKTAIVDSVCIAVWCHRYSDFQVPNNISEIKKKKDLSRHLNLLSAAQTLNKVSMMIQGFWSVNKIFLLNEEFNNYN